MAAMPASPEPRKPMMSNRCSTASAAAKIINTYQPAGKIEDFFQALADFKDLPTREQAIEKSHTAEQIDGLKRLFEAHGMAITGPPLNVDSNGK
jgi:hypothetical protein